jgi:hypothetical protein
MPPAAHIFLEGWARPLLLLHAVAAVALAGAATHQALVAFRLWRGAIHLGRLARVYSRLLGALYPAAFALGLLMYPHYRYAVRGLYLDRYAPWASNLFDVKENFAALGLPLALALFFVGRDLEPARDRPLLGFVAFLSIALWALMLTAALSGLLITDVRGV